MTANSDTGTNGGRHAQNLRAFRDSNPYAALGRAVSYLMTKPSFARVQFGHWSRTLTGQVNRKHYFFVANGDNVVGFVGWAFVNEAKAKAWAEGRADINASDLSPSGDCMVINAWSADTEQVNRFVLGELRKYAVGRRAAYAKRFYKGGRVRPLRITITDVLESHVTKNS